MLHHQERTDDMSKPLVSIVMGSKSDYDTMKAACDTLDKFCVGYEVMISSAHRCPESTAEHARTLEERGFKVVIAGAGMAAHLPGVLASMTTLPVIGVPLQAAALSGLDALLSIVQMPGGVPVATVAVGKAGAKNAAVLAVQMLALSDEALSQKLQSFKQEMKAEVSAANVALRENVLGNQ
ncbi:5-(carboxyamino)imidazole ribonucleotide mutase [bacterium]|nr:5-(carboxyamino)imidazole ribonucleotide mutase [bacterium]MBD3239364.1 5-(carboxyamino)imidazole ribonucleotide mutase [Chitinivibrionales bacterium]